MTRDPYRYFRVEAPDLLEGLSQGVLDLERGTYSRDLVGRLLRLAHTLKGASRVVKLADLARHAHALEDELAPYREGEGPIPPARVDTLLRLLDAMALQLKTIPAAAAPAGRPPVPPRAADEPFETVRIELEELDVLIQGVTEATVQIHSLHRESETIERARHLVGVLVEQLSPRRAAESTGMSATPARAHALAEELKDTLERFQRSISTGVEQASREIAQVREVANRLRLLPADTIFGPLERTARDAAQLLGKKAAFRTSGGDWRLDGHVLGALRGALLHVVRNAIAHGIESEAERVAAGKPPVGTVTLAVERRGNKVAFVCHDDGRGIDVEALRREAARIGILSEARSTALDPEELFRLVLKGGLTTTAAVTEVSGRGVGMDVVRETAERLGGEVSIRSESGRGATIEICVPVSLSSLSALLVDAGGVGAAVPLDAVRRTLRLAETEIARTSESDSIVYEGKVIPFVPLAKALRRPSMSARSRAHWATVILQSGNALAAVGVDRLLGTATVVVRPLPSNAGVEPVIAGASLDAEGNPQLVLDPAGLVRAASAGRGIATDAQPAPSLPILVVDDSLTTRMLEQSILESAGYEVDLASSAEDALHKAKDRRYGLFVVDVEMPGMDGFEFVEKTRSHPHLRDTPAILVTSRGSPEDRRRGEEAGARAFIVKGEFDQGYLLKTIRGLLG